MTIEDAAFIGVDLAWRSSGNNSGAAVLRGDRGGAHLVDVAEPLQSLDDVREFIGGCTSAVTVIAIDAPLIISNIGGQRACETAVGKRYGSREASCHTSNLRLYPDAPSVALAEDLIAHGYVHAPCAMPASSRVLLEVYPHAALVALFDLPKTIKYKRGSVQQKRLGLESLAVHIRRLSTGAPALAATEQLERVLSKPLADLRGAALKMHEDTLDALVCAYLAYYYWYWHMERTEVFGDVGTGYIVNPKLLRGGIGSHAA